MAKLSIVIAATLAIAAAALPSKPRLCGQVDAPDYMVSVPKFPNPQGEGHPGVGFIADQTSNDGAVTAAHAQVVQFNGPVGAYGCQIGLTFPSDVAKFYNATGTDGSVNPPTLNVYRIDGVDEWHTTYSGLRKRDGLFGTVTVRPGRQIINTVACPTAEEGRMAFLFEVPEWIRNTGASWQNYINGWDLEGSVGVFVNYNC